MKTEYYKYHGAGNDFILIDNRTGSFPINYATISKLCKRRFGIGADGLMLLNNHNEYDFEMLYFNSDGLAGTMCGNGGRCIVAFAKYLNIIDNKTNFLSSDGLHSAKIIESDTNESTIELNMSDVNGITIINNDLFIDTGSPHYVRFVDNYDFSVLNEGRKIRNNTEISKSGTNVNFVKVCDENIYVRTYERGVEDETYSCGTGVVASAIATSFIKSNKKNKFKIKTKGGDLEVRFNSTQDNFYNIKLIGSTCNVFKGEINI